MTQDWQGQVAHLRTWIGREEIAEDIITPELVRRFRATFDQAAGPLAAGTVAPRLIHFCLAQPADETSRLGEDGHPQRGGFLPPVSSPRRMWAGGRLSFSGDLCIGDAVRRRSLVTDVFAKDGGAGPLVFVIVEHTVLVGSKTVLRETHDIVYRGDGANRAKKPLPPAKTGAHQRRLIADTRLMFRYSALTFNGHRIHYDRPYATGVEGYPGLVVHGPLQATLLLNFASELRGQPPAHFAFKGLSPLFDGDVIALHADDEADGSLTLWTAREGGPVAMTSQARWA